MNMPVNMDDGVLVGLLVGVLVALVRCLPLLLPPYERSAVVAVDVISQAFPGVVRAAMGGRSVTETAWPASTERDDPHGPERECVACGRCTDCQIDGCRCDGDGAEQ